MDDETLLNAARQEDEQAFRELVARHQERIYRLASRLTGDHHAAEDLSQEAFLRLYRSLRSLHDGTHVSSWLYRVTLNLFLDQRRLRWLRGMVLRDGMDDLPEPHTDRDVPMDVERALKVLSSRERAVFVARQYHERRISEIAADLQIAEGTVKSLLFRAMRKLRKALADYQEPESC